MFESRDTIIRLLKTVGVPGWIDIDFGVMLDTVAWLAPTIEARLLFARSC